MALLTKSEIQSSQYSYDGSPWVRVSAKSTINLDTLEYSYDGSPWYGVEDITVTDSYVKLCGLNFTIVSKFNGALKSAITKINTISK
jgi:hypothetical protein